MRVAMKTSETLHKAADLIERQGWGTGSWSAAGPLCIEGAIYAAAGVEIHYPCPAYNAVKEYLSGRIEGTIFRWNDRLATTRVQAAIDAHDFSTPFDEKAAWSEANDAAKAEVISVLRATALIEAAKENPSAANPSPADDLAGLLVEAELGATRGGERE